MCILVFKNQKVLRIFAPKVIWESVELFLNLIYGNHSDLDMFEKQRLWMPSCIFMGCQVIFSC